MQRRPQQEPEKNKEEGQGLRTRRDAEVPAAPTSLAAAAAAAVVSPEAEGQQPGGGGGGGTSRPGSSSRPRSQRARRGSSSSSSAGGSAEAAASAVATLEARLARRITSNLRAARLRLPPAVWLLQGLQRAYPLARTMHVLPARALQDIPGVLQIPQAGWMAELARRYGPASAAPAPAHAAAGGASRAAGRGPAAVGRRPGAPGAPPAAWTAAQIDYRKLVLGVFPVRHGLRAPSEM
eukprot:COSAG01_NODE_4848_length_4685_cov_17.703663_4_plen_236_part_01